MGVYRLSNRLVRRIRKVDCRLPNAEGIPLLQVRKARGCVRTPKVSTKQNAAFYRFSHELLWSAMCPRIVLARHDRCVRLFILLLLAIAPFSIFAAAKNPPPMHLPGYKAVPVHYGPMNKMIMSVRINGQPANLLVDTGASQLILDTETAASFRIRPSQRGLRYIRFTQINGQDLPVGFAQNITASGMNFGSSPVTLRSSNHAGSGTGAGHVDGVLGLDILLRHKAVIN